MKIRMSTIIKTILYLLIILSLSLLKPFGNSNILWGSTSKIKGFCALMSVIMSIMILIYGKRKGRNLNIYVIIMTVVIILGILTTVNNGKTLDDAISMGYSFFFVLLSIPISYLLDNNYWNLEDMLKNIVKLTMISYLIRTMISVLYKYTGKLIFPNIAYEYAGEKWIRSGWLRINPPCFGNVIIPIAFYLYYKERNKYRKKYYLFVICSALAYSIFIHQARSLMLYQVIEIISIIIIKKQTNRRKIITFFIMCVLLLIAVNTPKVNSFFYSFNETSEYGASTTGRLEALGYYGVKYSKSPVRGLGLLNDEEKEVIGKVGWKVGTLSDLGFLWSIVQLGIGMIFYYIIFFIDGSIAGFKSKKVNKDDTEILAWGIVIAILITGINIDLFFGIYSFSAPFCISIIEKIKHNTMLNVKRRISA